MQITWYNELEGGLRVIIRRFLELWKIKGLKVEADKVKVMLGVEEG